MKRILFCTEGSYIKSGFGHYEGEIIPRLHAKGKYKIAEFSNYGLVGDKYTMPWRFYCNAVDNKDPRHAEFRSRETNQFGAWRFERVLLDFKPDIVVSLLDANWFTHQSISPLRDFYHWFISPTVDSSPQVIDWIWMFTSADAVATYSDFGFQTLQNEGGGKIPLYKPIYPGVNLDIFSPPKDKKEHRAKLGFDTDAFIIGTVMRNQKRKLYPNLLIAFKKFLDRCEREGRHDIAKKTYMYWHVSYPDNGWEIPNLLAEFELGHKVLFSYYCSHCDTPFASFFQDARTLCPNCKTCNAMLPNVNEGLSKQSLAHIIKTFDVYTQYSITEGLGYPLLEAAACGVPCMATDYSAMPNLIEHSGGVKLPVKTMFREKESQAYRAYPDDDALADAWFKYLNSSDEYRKKKEKQAREGAEKHYNWNTTVAAYEYYFDNVQLKGLQGKWDVPRRKQHTGINIPESIFKLSNPDFLDWMYINILNKPEEMYGYRYLQYLKDLNYELIVDGNMHANYSKKNVVNNFIRILNNFHHVEDCRTGVIQMPTEDFIEYADYLEVKNNKS